MLLAPDLHPWIGPTPSHISGPGPPPLHPRSLLNSPLTAAPGSPEAPSTVPVEQTEKNNLPNATAALWAGLSLESSSSSPAVAMVVAVIEQMDSPSLPAHPE